MGSQGTMLAPSVCRLKGQGRKCPTLYRKDFPSGLKVKQRLREPMTCPRCYQWWVGNLMPRSVCTLSLSPCLQTAVSKQPRGVHWFNSWGLLPPNWFPGGEKAFIPYPSHFRSGGWAESWEHAWAARVDGQKDWIQDKTSLVLQLLNDTMVGSLQNSFTSIFSFLPYVSPMSGQGGVSKSPFYWWRNPGS